MTILAESVFAILAVLLAVRSIAIAAGPHYGRLADRLVFVVAPLTLACLALTVFQLASRLQA